jgi:hypothetical protein
MCPRFMETDTNQGQPDIDISRRKFVKTLSGKLAIGSAGASAALQFSVGAQQTYNLTTPMRQNSSQAVAAL